MKRLPIHTIRNLTCVFLGLVFFTSGMSKLYFEHQFVGIIGPVWLEQELSTYGLGMFARFIGYAQVIIGFLLLTIRYATLGAVMLVPLVCNILVVTVSMEWKGTPFVLSLLLAMNIFVIWADRKVLLPIVTGTSNSYQLRKQTLKGVLTWVSAFILMLLSINMSFWSLPLAYLLVLSAFVLSIISFRLDK